MRRKEEFDSIVVVYNEQERFIHMDHIKPSKSEDVVSAWNYALKIASENQCSKWVINEKNKSVLPKDQEWLQQDWYSRSLELIPFSEKAPRYIALVKSDNFFVEFSTDNFVKENSFPGLELNVFKSVADGKSWLKKVG